MKLYITLFSFFISHALWSQGLSVEEEYLLDMTPLKYTNSDANPFPVKLVPFDSVIMHQWADLVQEYKKLERLRANGIISRSEMRARKEKIQKRIKHLVALNAVAARRED